MPRKSKKTGNVTVNITVNAEKKKKPRKKRAPRKRRGGTRAASYFDYTGPNTIYGEPLPLPRQTIEVNVPYQLQPGQRVATGEIGVPLLQNEPMRGSVLQQSIPKPVPSIMDVERPKLVKNTAEYDDLNLGGQSEFLPELNKDIQYASPDKRPPPPSTPIKYDDPSDTLEEFVVEKKPSIVQRIGSAVKNYAVPFGLETGANALIGSASIAGAGFGIPPAATAATLTGVKEIAKQKIASARLKKQTQQIVDETLTASLPLNYQRNTVSRYIEHFGGGEEGKRTATKAIRVFKNKNPNSTIGDFDEFLKQSK